MSVLSFREGRASDVRATFELGEAALDVSRKERGLLPPDHERAQEDLSTRWDRERGLLEFIVAQADGAFVICEDDDKMVGYTRIARFGEMDELTELWVAPSHAGLGVGRALLERCWPESPTPELGRVVLGIRLRGFPAWFAARSYHLTMMPGMERRIRLAADWTVGLLFGRASAELGQLGHPPSLQTYLDEARQPDEAPGQ